MKIKYTSRSKYLALALLFATGFLTAQVVQKIGDNPYMISPKTVLELESTTKGFLPPRLTVLQQTALGTTLPKGLLIYVTDGANQGIQLWDSTQWVFYVDSAALALKAPLFSPTFTGTVSGITSAMINLGNVNNTSDLAKPISTDTQTALNLKEDVVNKITNINSDPTSTTKYPSVSAVKNYVDAYQPIHAISTLVQNYTATAADYTLLCNTNAAAFQLTLPNPTTMTGRIYVIRKIDTSLNVLSIVPALKISDTSSMTSLNYPKTMRIQSNGTDWYVID